MSYYQGDFYQGDFYRGDPGFWGTLLGIGKTVAGFIPGVGGLAAKGLSMIPSGGAKIAKTVVAPAGTSMMRSGATSLIRRGVAAVKGHPVLSAAGAAGAIGGGYAIARPGRGAMTRMQPGMRRHKRMNVCNPRALRRAIRRTHGFAKLAMRTIHIVHPKKKGRFGGFRRRRARTRS